MQKFLTRNTVIGSVVFLAAFLVRLAFIWQWNATPYGAVPIVDAHAYDLWAQDIANGQILRAKAFYQSPLYPYVLALLYKIFGHFSLIASILNALLDALSCTILSLIALDCFGFEAALLTGALAALDRQLIFYTAPIMKESLGFFLMTMLLASVLRVVRRGKIGDFFLSGALLGLLALVRGNALFLAPAILLLAYIKWGRKSLGSCAAFTFATILFLLPATIHNAIVSHDFVMMSYDGGYNFYMGNSSPEAGSHTPVEGVATDPGAEETDTTRIAEQVNGGTLRPSEISAYWRDKALSLITQNPWQSLSLLLDKFLLFFYGGDLPDNYHIGFIAENFSTILSLPLPGFFLVFVAAAFSLAGFWRTRNNEAVMTLAILASAYMLSVLLFYVTDRFRMPIEVFLLPLAGTALPCAWNLVRDRHWGRFMTAIAVAVLFLILGLRSVSFDSKQTAYNDGVLGAIYRDLGQYQDALKWLRAGAEKGNANAQNNLGIMYHDGQGVPQDYTQAMQWIHKAAEQDNVKAEFNLGLMYHEGQGTLQDYTQAKQWFSKAAEQGDINAQYSLGIMDKEGQGKQFPQ